MTKKRLLVVAYFFPPSGLVGSVRITKLVKYLLRFGWDITVLTVREEFQTPEWNEQWLKEVAGARIIRTGLSLRRFYPLREHGFFWRRNLRKALKELLAKEHFDVALWTGGPFMHFSLAAWTRKRYHLPYVLDFRDPWTTEQAWPVGSLLSRFKHFVAVQLERRSIEHASAVVQVTESCRDAYLDCYPNARFVIIHNGVDLEDFENIVPRRISEFDIIYPGKFADLCDPKVFFHGFRSFIDERKLTPEQIRFVWIGNREAAVDEYIAEFRLDSYVARLGFLPYSEVISYLLGSGCGLLLRSYEHTLATKTFDYLAANKRVLQIDTFPGKAEDVLSQFKSVLRISPEEIEKGLAELYTERFSAPEPEVHLHDFSREEIARRMEALLLDVIDGKL